MEHLVALSSVNIIPRSEKVTCICHLPSGDHHQGWTKVSVVLSTARLDFGFGFFSNLKNHFRVFQNLLSYSSGHHHYLHLSSAMFNFSTLPNLKSDDKTNGGVLAGGKFNRPWRKYWIWPFQARVVCCQWESLCRPCSSACVCSSCSSLSTWVCLPPSSSALPESMWSLLWQLFCRLDIQSITLTIC